MFWCVVVWDWGMLYVLGLFLTPTVLCTLHVHFFLLLSLAKIDVLGERLQLQRLCTGSVCP